MAESEATPTGAGRMRRQARRSFAPWSDSDAKPLVRFEGVGKRFAGVTAVDDITLDIFEGEFFALLGPSGCGKTTLLRLLAGFETPDTGRILLDGRDVTRVPPHRRPVNMMFQNYALFPHLNVARNVAFGLKQEGLPKDEIAERVSTMLALLKLDGLDARMPDQLSGGQRQRVALARSLVKRPRVLLLDEPLAALDKKLRAETQFELMHLREQLGLTFIIVTHDQEEAMIVADRIAAMNQGRIVQVAPPPEIYEQPNSRWVADFIGEVNLIEAKVIARASDGLTLVSAALGAFRAAGEANVEETVFVALRPEKLAISAAPPPDPALNRVSGTVWDIGYRGDLSVYRVRLDNGFAMKATAANLARAVERSIGFDDRVWLSWPAEAGTVLKR